MGKNIGWIGTGTTGKTLCSHLIKAGHDVKVYNRSVDKCHDLIEMGANLCLNPADVAEQSEIVITMLGFPEDVQNVYFGESGLLENPKPGKIFIDMTTSEPEIAKLIYHKAREKGCYALDAPIEGPDLAPRNKSLTIMVGGDERIFDDVYSILKVMGEDIRYVGDAGSGHSTKIANQILIASTMIGVIESLQFAYKMGLDLNKTIDVIGKGTAASWSINNLGKRIIEGKFSTGFYIKHFVKDMGIALKEAEKMRLALPGLSLVHQFYLIAMNLGFEDLGTQAIYQVFAKMNDIPL